MRLYRILWEDGTLSPKVYLTPGAIRGAFKTGYRMYYGHQGQKATIVQSQELEWTPWEEV
jgi:hypothetical protein